MANVNLNKEAGKSQNKMIARWLEEGNTITSLVALQMFGCMRLASRICDLRDQGYDIEKKTIVVSSGKRVTEYKLK